MNNLSGFVKRLRDIMRNDAGINGDAQRIEQIAWMLFLKVYDAKEQDWAFDDERYVSILPEVCRWANWAHDDKSGSAMTGDKLLGFVNNTLFPVLKGRDVKDASGKTIVEGIRVTAQTPIKKAIVQTVFADANQYMKDGVLLRQVINVIDELDLSDYEESHAFNEIYEGILKELQSAGSAGEFYTPRAVTDFMARMIQPRIGEQMADFACGTGGFITSWLGELQKQIKKYLEACSGVMVQEVRVFVDSTIPADEKTEASPYAIPTALLGLDADPLPVGKPEKQDEPEPQTEEQQGAEAECGVEPEADEPETKADDTAEEAAQEDEHQTAEQEQGEQA